MKIVKTGELVSLRNYKGEVAIAKVIKTGVQFGELHCFRVEIVQSLEKGFVLPDLRGSDLFYTAATPPENEQHLNVTDFGLWAASRSKPPKDGAEKSS